MTRRKGFTLLEVMLSLAISLMLMAVLYAALDVQFRTMNTGQDAAAEGQLARGLLNRMANDIRNSLGTINTDTSSGIKLTTNSSSSSNSSTSNSSSSSSSNSTTTTPTEYNFGIQGQDTQIYLYPTTVPHFDQTTAQNQATISDMRIYSYQLAGGRGLVRQAYQATAPDGSMNAIGSPEVLGPEVVALGFRYFDQTSGQWNSSWDGSQLGPPMAVEITLAIQTVARRGAKQKPPAYHRAVVAIPTASTPQLLIDQQAGIAGSSQ
jgi:prepilin-type N-terminal cleavage/methylation domain-containing protein